MDSCSSDRLLSGRTESLARRPRKAELGEFPSDNKVVRPRSRLFFWSRSTIANRGQLESFLGSKVGSGLWGSLKRCMKTMAIEQYFQRDAEWSGLRMSRLTGGNDPAFGCRARSSRWSFPPFSVPRVNPKPDHSLISSASRMYRNRIGTEGTHETLHEQSRSPGDISIGSECGEDLV